MHFIRLYHSSASACMDYFGQNSDLNSWLMTYVPTWNILMQRYSGDDSLETSLVSDAAEPEAGKDYVCEDKLSYSVHNSFTISSKLIQFPEYSQISHLIWDQERDASIALCRLIPGLCYLVHCINSLWRFIYKEALPLKARTGPTNSDSEMSSGKGLLSVNLCCLEDPLVNSLCPWITSLNL